MQLGGIHKFQDVLFSVIFEQCGTPPSGFAENVTVPFTSWGCDMHILCLQRGVGSLRRACILLKIAERLLDMADRLERTLVGMMAHGIIWLLVQSLYFVIIFCTVCRGIKQTKLFSQSSKQENTYQIPQKSFSFTKIKKLDKSLFVGRRHCAFEKYFLHSLFSIFTNRRYNLQSFFVSFLFQLQSPWFKLRFR